MWYYSQYRESCKQWPSAAPSTSDSPCTGGPTRCLGLPAKLPDRDTPRGAHRAGFHLSDYKGSPKLVLNGMAPFDRKGSPAKPISRTYVFEQFCETKASTVYKDLAIYLADRWQMFEPDELLPFFNEFPFFCRWHGVGFFVC